ncbi:hypothetical protein JCGZ_04455 [Jatropha curcas]|uniref:J domain-containing protein n=1 Tax=Jatropha curcas TaxID=180498 RepID=A0A067L210_JATCU|nr:auxilin-like protein 1 [Jatropha curcas]KDP38530.1 hypothetical protein JCGZ_04455 [Jatropha curcas]
MDYQHPSSATTFSKKLANGVSLSGKHEYDGVFVGAANSGSRMEDYGEIFGGSSKCSIPILDFPDLKDSKSSVDARNSRPDYSKIFGGFGDADFAVPYEELFAKPKKVKSSSKGARAAAEAKFCPAEPKHSNFSGEKQAPSPEVSFQSFDGVKQFNSSYDKSNPRSKNGTNGITHIAQLHAIPGNNCLIGEINPPRMMRGDKPLQAVLNDADMNINVNEGIMQRKTLRKVVSGPQPRVAAVDPSRSRADFQTKPNRNKSFSNDISFDAFEIGLGTEQSPMSPLSSLPDFGNNRDGTIRSMNSKFGGFRGNASEIAAGSYSRPFLDAEIDANSAAANVSEGIMQQKTLRKVVSGPQPRGAAIDTSRNPADFRTKPGRNRSFSNDISFDAFEIGRGTQQSPMSPLSTLPNFGNNGDGSIRSMNSSFRVFRGDASEVAAGSYSPPFLDEEIDANSAAATSAAAVSKAIEEAKAKLKIAKELMERRKEGTANRVKPSVNRLKAERREVKAAEKANSSSEKPQEMHQKVDLTSLAEHEAIKANQVTPDVRNVKKSSPVQSAVGENHSSGFKQTQVDHGLEPENEKAVKGFSEPADTRERNGMVLEVKLVNNVLKVKPSASEKKCEEKMTGVENIKKPMEHEKKEALEGAHKQEIERELNPVEKLFEWNVYRNNIKSTEELFCQEENQEKTGVAFKDEEADRAPKVPDEQEETQGIEKRLNEPEENEKIEIQELKEIENVEEPNEAHDGMKIEKKQREAQNQEKGRNLSTEVPVREENERRLDEILRHEGNGKGQEEGLERVECEKKQQEGWIQEENKKKPNDVSKPKDNENSGQAHKQEATEVRFNDFQDEKGSEKRLRKDCGTKDNKGLEEAEQNEILNKVFQINETEKERTCEWVETLRTLTGIHLETKDENNVEVAQLAFRYKENHLTANLNVYRLDDNDTAGEADEAHGVEENFGSGEVNDKVLADEFNRRTVEVTEDSFPEETEKRLKGVEESNDMEEEENFEIGVSEEGLVVPDAIKKQKAHSCSGDETEYERICEQEKDIEEHTSQLDGHYEDASEFVIGSNDEENESDCVSSHERLLGNGMQSKTQKDPEKDAEDTACKLGENNDVKESEVAINHEDETYSESSSDEKFVNIRSNLQASQQAHSFYGEGMSIGTSEEERTNQRTDEKEESHHETVTVEKRGAEDSLQKEVELEKEHHRRKDEAKLREMEKEKERIAVERAIREARERAFAEARERAERAAAERATAGANQRVMAEARERLEKACAEANSKSAAEKASMEAKLKAERAAVERATAEARERALEKAMSEKATFKAKNQSEKSAAEKFSGASRDAVMKSSDLQSNCSGPSSSSRYTSSSSHDERFGGVNGESTERCKATLARNQRTAERAAKALAEKNMRDLLAQKEQAERNRLAETLDADVKRWSSGKERNLRALLSTLQYILGPDSGWQPIPLTDLITTAAVKKAYRKATLIVHPDKLQQRGASIQQKYTCEKVFDLLKDAWNKFSAEER